MKRRSLPLLAAVLVLVATMLVGVPAALAAAIVQVRLVSASGQPAEGTVTVSPAAGGSFSCRTQAGTCTIPNVPGGRATVTVVPARGAAPPPRTVMIPPSGNVSLIVNTVGH